MHKLIISTLQKGRVNRCKGFHPPRPIQQQMSRHVAQRLYPHQTPEMDRFVAMVYPDLYPEGIAAVMATMSICLLVYGHSLRSVLADYYYLVNVNMLAVAVGAGTVGGRYWWWKWILVFLSRWLRDGCNHRWCQWQ